MNWLQKTSQYPQLSTQPLTVESIFGKLLEGTEDITFAAGEISRLGDPRACEEIQRLGGMPRQDGTTAAANSIASRLMEFLGCEGSPDPPDGENNQMQPMQMPNLGEQDAPMDTPSAEFG